MEVDMKAVCERLAQRVAQLELENTVMQLALEKYQDREVPVEGTVEPE